MDQHLEVPNAVNEPILTYAPGSPERAALSDTLREMRSNTAELRSVIGGREHGVPSASLIAPHDHQLELARVALSGRQELELAVQAARDTSNGWSTTSFRERAGVFLKAAELLAGPWRSRLNAATMLGQSKSVHQAQIDSACEMIDFLRFNVCFAQEIYDQQPLSNNQAWNSMDYRPLEGFILAITPFNFTSIAGNLPSAPALMGNTVVWKPARSQAFAAVLFMQLLSEAGLPDGVINLVLAKGEDASAVCLNQPDLAGVHFTGSSEVMYGIWETIGANIRSYASYPRVVGETGGKDFVVAHESADVQALAVALVHGAFEYQGQKCSAASRAYVPRRLWPEVRGRMAEILEVLPTGDVSNFATAFGAVIDGNSYRRIETVLARSAEDEGVETVIGGQCSDEVGWFVSPTVLRVEDPKHDLMVEELFGPVLSIYVYDEPWESILDLVDGTSPYGLTGAVFGRDLSALEVAAQRLRNAAGNYYVNDKPTGAVVAQQPFGGSRASGTNDKAGSILNLQRWVSPRTIKVAHVSRTEPLYPHQLPE